MNDDYEILRFNDVSGGWIYKSGDGQWYGIRRYTYEELLKNHAIYEMRRLSDGASFWVGQLICDRLYNENYGNITKFELTYNGGVTVYFGQYSLPLCNIKETKQLPVLQNLKYTTVILPK